MREMRASTSPASARGGRLERTAWRRRRWLTLRKIELGGGAAMGH
jgi:hypothetical protein